MSPTVCPERSSRRSNTVVDFPFISITGIPLSPTEGPRKLARIGRSKDLAVFAVCSHAMPSQIDKLRSVFCAYVVDKALAKRLVPILLLRQPREPKVAINIMAANAAMARLTNV